MKKFKLNFDPQSAEFLPSPEVSTCCSTIAALARALAIMRNGDNNAVATPQDTLAAATLYAAESVRDSDFTITPHNSTPSQKGG